MQTANEWRIQTSVAFSIPSRTQHKGFPEGRCLLLTHGYYCKPISEESIEEFLFRGYPQLVWNHWILYIEHCKLPECASCLSSSSWSSAFKILTPLPESFSVQKRCKSCRSVVLDRSHVWSRAAALASNSASRLNRNVPHFLQAIRVELFLYPQCVDLQRWQANSKQAAML